VTDYGADPTGRLDSTEALQQAISDAFGSPVDTHLMEGVADLMVGHTRSAVHYVYLILAVVTSWYGAL